MEFSILYHCGNRRVGCSAVNVSQHYWRHGMWRTYWGRRIMTSPRTVQKISSRAWTFEIKIWNFQHSWYLQYFPIGNFCKVQFNLISNLIKNELEHWHFNRAASGLDTPKHYRKLKIAALEFVGVKKLKMWQAIVKQSNYCTIVLPQQIQELWFWVF